MAAERARFEKGNVMTTLHHVPQHRKHCPPCRARAGGFVGSEWAFASACEAFEHLNAVHWIEDALDYVDLCSNAPPDKNERKVFAFALGLRAAGYNRACATKLLLQMNARVDEPIPTEARLLEIIDSVFGTRSAAWPEFRRAFGGRP